jgi:biopolymer transport protein ExbB
VINAFHHLSTKTLNAEQETLSNIAEALTATAIGLLVAIPAVIAFNFFSRKVRAIMGGTDEVAHTVLSLIHGAERGAERGADRTGGTAVAYKEAGDGGE